MSYQKISIIIPVYRYSPYLSIALDSALHQDFELPYEVVICGIGADEKTKETCLEYERQYPEMIQSVFSDVNYGISLCRNVGLLKARGEYVFFLDSDDAISSNTLSTLYHTVEKGNYDIVTGSFYRKQGEKNHFSSSYKGTGITVVKKFMTSVFTPFAPYCWGRLYRKDILDSNRIWFSSDLPIFEDWLFFVNSFYHAKKVKFIKDNLYFYREDENTTMHSKQDAVSYSLLAIKKIREFLSQVDPKLERNCYSKVWPAMKLKLRYASKESQEYYNKNTKEIYKEALIKLKEIYRRDKDESRSN